MIDGSRFTGCLELVGWKALILFSRSVLLSVTARHLGRKTTRPIGACVSSFTFLFSLLPAGYHLHPLYIRGGQPPCSFLTSELPKHTHTNTHNATLLNIQYPLLCHIIFLILHMPNGIYENMNLFHYKG